MWPGEIPALLGSNGAGKTTTVEILEGYVLVTVASVAEVGLLLVVGTLFVRVCLPADGVRWLTFGYVFALGLVGCTLLGIAASRLTHSARTAPGVLNLIFLVLEFMSGVFTLVDALRRQADRAGGECGIPVTFEQAGEVGDLPMPVEVVLLRAAQEAWPTCASTPTRRSGWSARPTGSSCGSPTTAAGSTPKRRLAGTAIRVLLAVEAAAGYLLKDAAPAELGRAIRAAARGETVLAPSVAARPVSNARRPGPAQTLSARELEVLRLVGRGLTNADIGRALFISEATVRTHPPRMFAKLGVSDRTAAVTTAMARGFLN